MYVALDLWLRPAALGALLTTRRSKAIVLGATPGPLFERTLHICLAAT
jgi:hypothetical protein